MRTMLVSLFALGTLVSAAAQCRGFCDEEPPQDPNGPILPWPIGGQCLQERETWLSSGPSPSGGPVVRPEYSDFPLGELIGGSDEELEFDLDVSGLNPSYGPGTNAIEVFELGIGLMVRAEPEPAHRVLAISAVPGPLNRWSLQFDWLDVPANWSVVDSLAPTHLVSRSVQLPPDRERFNITIIPAEHWQTVNVRIGAIDPATLRESWSFVIEGAFEMPLGAGSQRAPTRLRTGVLGGNLGHAGMRSSFIFYRPNLRSGVER